MIKQFKKATDSNRYNIGGLKIPKNYDPLTDENDFMNPVMLAYFWRKLRNEYSDLGRSIDTLQRDIRRPNTGAENLDRSQTSMEREASIRDATRQEAKRMLVKNRIDDIELNGTRSGYGYCEETGKEIGIKRLLAEPTARKTVDAQEQAERADKLYAGLKK